MNNVGRQTALVLGASSGIGNACARALFTEGYNVYGISRTVDANSGFSQMKADLTDPLSQEKVTSLILETNPDAMVFCVGESRPDSIKSVEVETTRRLFEVNVLSLLNPLKVLATELPQKPRSVVLISSIHARGQHDRLSYSISKSALEAIMASTSKYLIKQGIRINCVRPGPTETEMLLKNFPLGSEDRKSYLKKIPAGRFAKTDEIVGIIRYLLSDQASYITGQNIEVTGGF